MIRDVLTHIMQQYQLPTFGTHGVTHWARVFTIGERLALETGADMQVVELFAVFHDACRVNELRDDGHGRRGSDLVNTLRNKLFLLDDKQFRLLTYACSFHTDGLKDADITVQTCWDSDRLDLLRCDIMPDTSKLCTRAAQRESMLRWANERAQQHYIPHDVLTQWGLENKVC